MSNGGGSNAKLSSRLAGVNSSRGSARNRCDPKYGSGGGFKEDQTQVRSGYFCCSGGKNENAEQELQNEAQTSTCTIF